MKGIQIKEHCQWGQKQQEDMKPGPGRDVDRNGGEQPQREGIWGRSSGLGQRTDREAKPEVRLFLSEG